eukprot:6179181-Pleurochrysis_carterae.AAC.1
MISLRPHNLGILRFCSSPCKWEIGVAEELTSEEMGKMVQNPELLDNPRDGVYRADAAPSPWYESFPFMRWVDQFLMKPDAWMAPLPSIQILAFSEPCALFVSSYPSFGCVSYPTFCKFMEGHDASAPWPKEHQQQQAVASEEQEKVFQGYAASRKAGEEVKEDATCKPQRKHKYFLILVAKHAPRSARESRKPCSCQCGDPAQKGLERDVLAHQVRRNQYKMERAMAKEKKNDKEKKKKKKKCQM